MSVKLIFLMSNLKKLCVFDVQNLIFPLFGGLFMTFKDMAFEINPFWLHSSSVSTRTKERVTCYNVCFIRIQSEYHCIHWGSRVNTIP